MAMAVEQERCSRLWIRKVEEDTTRLRNKVMGAETVDQDNGSIHSIRMP